jgi:hypothetical protein
MSKTVFQKMRRWRHDAVYFVCDQFKVEPDKWQLDVLKAASTEQRIAMKACKGPGKTCVLAWIAWWFMCTRPHPKIAATSISGDNLSDNLWPELAKWQAKSPFLKDKFKWTKTRIFAKDHPETWFMAARSWPKTADPSKQADTLAGLHADYIMFILDEAGGIPDAIVATAEAALATGKECKLIMAGNPTQTSGPLYRACTKEKHLWWTISITSDPDNPKRTPRVSIEWARQQIEKYGKDNPWVLVNVFGEFPPSSINQILSADEVERAMGRQVPVTALEHAQKRIGVDVARFGDDSTVLFPRQGLMAFEPVQMRNARNPDIAARVMMAKNKWRSEYEFVDGTGGYGGGVIDAMLNAGAAPVEVMASGKANSHKYRNRRAENWFRMAEWVKRGGCLPKAVNELSGELTVATYTFDNQGRFLLMPKEQMKEELGRSPDFADALALTFTYPEMQASNLLPGLNRAAGKVKSEWNPIQQ